MFMNLHVQVKNSSLVQHHATEIENTILNNYLVIMLLRKSPDTTTYTQPNVCIYLSVSDRGNCEPWKPPPDCQLS